MEERNPGKHLKPFSWKPGQTGNPKGRPRGARSHLGEDFLKALHEDFLIHGVKAIQSARKKDPVQYIKTIASIIPKEMTLKIDPLEEMTDAELLHRIHELHDILGPTFGRNSASIAAPSEDGSGAELPSVRSH